MRRTGFWIAGVMGLALTLVSTRPVSAEVFLDVYAGGVFYGHPDFTVHTNGGTSAERERGTASDDITYGGRVGYWFVEQGLPWLGVAGDVSYMEPEYRGATGDLHVKVRTVPMSPLLMLRIPLFQAPDYPGGQFQIYSGVGPGFFWTEQTARGGAVGEKISADTIEVGVDFRAGLAWQFLPNWKVFAEYRMTSYSISVKQTTAGREVKVDADLDTNQALFGIGYSF